MPEAVTPWLSRSGVKWLPGLPIASRRVDIGTQSAGPMPSGRVVPAPFWLTSTLTLAVVKSNFRNSAEGVRVWLRSLCLTTAWPLVARSMTTWA